jgi:O-antigen/teichoic acid export membrane protein
MKINLLSDSTKVAFSANFLTQLIIGFGQLLSVPIYLRYWGDVEYGKWIILIGFVSTMTILELGIASSACNSLIKSLSQNNKKDSDTYIWIVKFFSLIASGLFFIAALVLFCTKNSNFLYKIGEAEFELYSVVCLLIYAGCILIFNAASGVLRAFGGSATSAVISTGCIFIETIFPPLLAINDLSINKAIYGLLIGRLPGVILACLLCVGLVKNYKGGNFILAKNKLYELFASGVSGMFVPGAVSIQLQFPLFCLTSFVAPQAAALYASARTLSRVIFQFGYIYTRSVLPKITKLYTEKNLYELKKINKNIAKTVWWFMGGASILYCLFGKFVFNFWTGGRFNVDSHLFLILGAAIFLHGYWHVLMSMLMAINKHNLCAVFCLFFTGLMCVGMYYFGIDIYRVACFALAFELCMLFSCMFFCRIHDLSILAPVERVLK